MPVALSPRQGSPIAGTVIGSLARRCQAPFKRLSLLLIRAECDTDMAEIFSPRLLRVTLGFKVR